MSLLLPALVASSTVVAGASTTSGFHSPLVESAAPSNGQAVAHPNTSGPRPPWAGVESPFAADVAANTYGSMVGLNPLPSACGDTNPIAVLGAMYTVKQLGSGMIRCDLNWWSVQPYNATTYYWDIYDNVVNAASKFGIQILFDASFTPPWARPNPLPPGTQDPSHVPPKHIGDFARFIRAAVNRYSPKGHARVASVVGTVSNWEIWNEPNLVGGWTPPDPARYSKFLSDVQFVIRQIDKRATIISGGLAPAGNVNGNYAPQDFVAKLAQAGGLKRVDGVGIHPYSFPAYPDEAINFNPIYNAVPAMYYVMAVYGYADKKIWATEVGWPTSSQSPETYRFWDGVQVGTEAYQAKELPLTITTWFKGRPFAGPIFVYAQRDKCTNNTQWLCKMGIERTDGSKKPAWTTVHAQLLKPFVR